MSRSEQKIETIRLELSWSVSRGRDTYGYNICRLDDTRQGKRYRCNGGGYDMIGTVIGQWAQDVLQDELLSIHRRAAVRYDFYQTPRERIENKRKDALYGLTEIEGLEYTKARRKKEGKDMPLMQIDGACGRTSVEKIIEACGWKIETMVSKRGHCRGFIVWREV
jgi:hypothetical protein